MVCSNIELTIRPKPFISIKELRKIIGNKIPYSTNATYLCSYDRRLQTLSSIDTNIILQCWCTRHSDRTRLFHRWHTRQHLRKTKAFNTSTRNVISVQTKEVAMTFIYGKELERSVETKVHFQGVRVWNQVCTHYCHKNVYF